MVRILLIFLVVFLSSGFALTEEPAYQMELSPEVRAWFRNPDGSCVQCSIGMMGVWGNDQNAASLLWDTRFGEAERGGSWPSRVSNYCQRRGIQAYNITGDITIDWLRWAGRTGRFAAMGAGSRHFQTFYGWNPETDRWQICNNNSTHRIDDYSFSEMKRLHYASGPWVVILKRPSSNPPKLVNWWSN